MKEKIKYVRDVCKFIILFPYILFVFIKDFLIPDSFYMTIKEYWGVYKKSKDLLADLNREIENKKIEKAQKETEYELELEYLKKDIELQKREAALEIRGENFEVITRLERENEWLKFQLQENPYKVFYSQLLSILDGNYHKIKERGNELQNS